MKNIKLSCIECKKEFPFDKKEYRCTCGNLLEVKRELNYSKESLLKLFSERLLYFDLPYSSGVWRYNELILGLSPEDIISRNEGNTNLYSSEKLEEYTGIKKLKIKHEGENPTGSFKDRGMTTAISVAKLLGYSAVACASTGNTSASMASYAAVSGMNAYVFIPEGNIAYGKLAQTLAYGATTVQVKGNFDFAMEEVQKICEKNKICLLNSINPYRIEGQKSIFFELMQQLKWNAPDWIVLPGGNLGNTSAFGKAIKEAYELGLIKKKPRLAVIQARGANPFYRYMNLNKNSEELKPIIPETIATAIKIGNPISWKKAKKAIKDTNGIIEELSEDEILEAKAYVDSAGIGAEPASCCSIGGAKKLREKNIIKEGESVVTILTGHILKDPDSIIKYHNEGFGKFKLCNKPISLDEFQKSKL
jgi:threonine synthase